MLILEHYSLPGISFSRERRFPKEKASDGEDGGGDIQGNMEVNECSITQRGTPWKASKTLKKDFAIYEKYKDESRGLL